MSAQIQIDQAGLPAGTPGYARTDGLDTGALVTLTSVSGGSTHTFRLLWVPPDDVTAVASLLQTGPTTWTFSPTAGVWGSYRIELVVDEGLPTEERQIRIFGIRTPVAQLLTPAANERADAATTLVNVNPAAVQRSEQNEAFGPFLTGSAWGWWRAWQEVVAKVETLAAGGGGGGVRAAPKIVVGSSAQGDTLGVTCDFLDPGDGSGIEAALAAAGGVPGSDVWVRPGVYGPGLAPPFVIPAGVTVRGAGTSLVVVSGSQTQRRVWELQASARLEGLLVQVPTGTPGAMVGAEVILCTQATLRQVAVIATGIDPTEPTESLTAVVRVQGGIIAGAEDCVFYGVKRLPVGQPALTGVEVAGGTAQVLRTLVFGADRGVHLVNTDSCVVSDCRIVDTVEHAIGVQDSDLAKINGSSLEASAQGAWVAGTAGVRIYGTDGRCTVTGNTIQTNGPGTVGILLDTAGFGSNAVNGNMIDATAGGGGGDAITLTATEQQSVVVGNVVRNGFLSDFGVGNVMAHNI